MDDIYFMVYRIVYGRLYNGSPTIYMRIYVLVVHCGKTELQKPESVFCAGYRDLHWKTHMNTQNVFVLLPLCMI